MNWNAPQYGAERSSHRHETPTLRPLSSSLCWGGGADRTNFEAKTEAHQRLQRRVWDTRWLMLMMVHDGSSTRCCLLVDGYWPWAPWGSSLVHRLETPPRVEKMCLWHHEKKNIATVYHRGYLHFATSDSLWNWTLVHFLRKCFKGDNRLYHIPRMLTRQEAW